jgi:putative chitinase
MNESARNLLRTRLLHDTRVLSPLWVAYMLATVRHETAGTYAPIVERGSPAYFTKRYWENEKVRGWLGNLSREDAVRYKGRGYVQITGRALYKKLGTEIEEPLVEDPDRALDPDVSYKIMVVGMTKGRFTGKKLSDYFGGDKCDWVNARRIINGIDRAELIAQYAQEELKLLST